MLALHPHSSGIKSLGHLLVIAFLLANNRIQSNNRRVSVFKLTILGGKTQDCEAKKLYLNYNYYVGKQAGILKIEEVCSRPLNNTIIILYFYLLYS